MFKGVWDVERRNNYLSLNGYYISGTKLQALQILMLIQLRFTTTGDVGIKRRGK